MCHTHTHTHIPRLPCVSALYDLDLGPEGRGGKAERAMDKERERERGCGGFTEALLHGDGCLSAITLPASPGEPRRRLIYRAARWKCEIEDSPSVSHHCPATDLDPRGRQGGVICLTPTLPPRICQYRCSSSMPLPLTSPPLHTSSQTRGITAD